MFKITRFLRGAACQLAAQYEVREPFTVVTDDPISRAPTISVYDGRTGSLAGTVTQEDILEKRWRPTTLAHCGGYIPATD